MFVERSITTYENNSFQTVQLMRDSPIRQNVSVRVVGGKDYDLLVRKIPKFLEHFHQFFFITGPNRSQQFVETSGTDVNTSVTFRTDGPDKVTFRFQLIDDQKGLESVERYPLTLNSSMPSNNRVNLSSIPLQVNILDNDGEC